MKELIEKLKHNERPFGLLSKEEQECLRKVGRTNLEYYHQRDDWTAMSDYQVFMHDSTTYRIKPDYQPEPEFVDLEIKLISNYRNLGINTCGKFNINYGVVYLYEIPSMPNFVGFFDSTRRIAFQMVSEEISEGHKVIARFRK